ncbi:hypothetical protein U1Q18_009674 [Sarracenia purpurea var. burkii]
MVFPKNLWPDYPFHIWVLPPPPCSNCGTPHCPPKVQLLVWLAHQDRVPTKDLLVRWGCLSPPPPLNKPLFVLQFRRRILFTPICGLLQGLADLVPYHGLVGVRSGLAPEAFIMSYHGGFSRLKKSAFLAIPIVAISLGMFSVGGVAPQPVGFDAPCFSVLKPITSLLMLSLLCVSSGLSPAAASWFCLLCCGLVGGCQISVLLPLVSSFAALPLMSFWLAESLSNSMLSLLFLLSYGNFLEQLASKGLGEGYFAVKFVDKGLAVGLKQVSKGLGKVFLCAPIGKFVVDWEEGLCPRLAPALSYRLVTHLCPRFAVIPKVVMVFWFRVASSTILSRVTLILMYHSAVYSIPRLWVLVGLYLALQSSP